MTTSAGIDYGLGQTNLDTATGIRYGVIAQHSISPEAFESFEADYGHATCPRCGNEVAEYASDQHTAEEIEAMPEYETGRGCDDFVCHLCRYVFDAGEAYAEEPLGHSYTEEGYRVFDCLDTDLVIERSPYFTYAPFCSPCVPGAGNLDDATDDQRGVKTYCFGHDWFDSGTAPYVVYSVETGKVVEP
jgi:rubredoxin